jgi:hypothetical protein
LDFYSDITAGGSIGSVTITADEDGIDYESSIRAEGNIGNVNISAGDAGIVNDATLRSDAGSIATGVGESLTVTAARGEGIDGNVYAFNSIGDINVVVTEAEGNEAIIADITAQNGTIGNITVNSAANANTINALINAATGIGNVSVTSTGTGNFIAVQTSTFNANTQPAWLSGSTAPAQYGQIGNITVSSSFTGTGINAGSVNASKIGNIAVTMTNADAGFGINGASFNASTNVETVVGSGQYDNYGQIGTVTVINQTTQGNGGGITGAVFNAGSAGNLSSNPAIGNIVVTIANASAAGIAPGIFNTSFNAANGTGSDTIENSTIGTITVTNTTTTGAGISGSEFIANDGVGAIQVTAQGSGISGNKGVFTVSADADSDSIGDVGNISVTITGAGLANGIDGSIFNGANIGNVTVNVTNDANTGDGITNAKFNAQAENAAGTVAIGEIGNIAVTSASISGDGIDTSIFNAGIGAKNAIGTVNVALANSSAYAIFGTNFDATNVAGGEVAGDQVSTIGTITTTGANSGVNFSAEADDSIGAISSTGTDIQNVSADVNANVSFTANIAATETSIGSITLNNSIAKNSVNLTYANSLTALTSMGNLTVDGNVLGGKAIGVSTATTGGITGNPTLVINSDITGSANSVTFNFASTFAGSVTEATVLRTPFAAAPSTVTHNGATFVLV